MKQKFSFTLVTIVTLLFALSSCSAIGGLMKTSFWAGAIFVILIIGIIIYVIARMGRKG